MKLDSQYVDKAFNFISQELDFERTEDQFEISKETIRKINKLFKLAGINYRHYFECLCTKVESVYNPSEFYYNISSVTKKAGIVENYLDRMIFIFAPQMNYHSY